jgi:hypothetical protein
MVSPIQEKSDNKPFTCTMLSVKKFPCCCSPVSWSDFSLMLVTHPPLRVRTASMSNSDDIALLP